jgi:hypothetical protein
LRRFKKTLIVVGILLGVLIFMGGALAMNKEEYRENFSVEPGTVLNVYNKTGSIDISSWDRDYVEVEAVKEKRWWTSFLKEPGIDVKTGNEFVVRTLYSTVLSKAISVRYRITVPKGMLVKHIETSTGQIHVDKVSGDVDVETSTGEIQIHQVNGFVKAVTSTGKIHVDNISGEVDAQTSTGEIQIHQVKGFVKAVTSCGKIDITEIGGLYEARTDTGKITTEVPAIKDNLEIKSSTGSIIVFLSRDVAGDLEVSASNGKITYTGLPLNVSEFSKTKLSGRLGGESHPRGSKINIKTSTGSITLKKLGC